MDPFLVITILGIALRRHAGNKYNSAIQERHRAVSQYRKSRNQMIATRRDCQKHCQTLASSRLASMSNHWSRLNALLIAAGLNGGIFAPSRVKVFGDVSPEKIRRIIGTIEQLKVVRVSVFGSGVNTIAVSLLIRGIRYLDSPSALDASHLEANFAEPSNLTDFADGNEVATAYDAFDLGDILDVASSVLIMFRLLRAHSMLSAANDLSAEASRIVEAAADLDRKTAILSKGAIHAKSLVSELEVASYGLFKRIVVAEEMAKDTYFQSCLKSEFSLPDWLVLSLLKSSNQLWIILNEPVFE